MLKAAIQPDLIQSEDGRSKEAVAKRHKERYVYLIKATAARKHELITAQALNFQAIAVNMQPVNENPMQAPGF